MSVITGSSIVTSGLTMLLDASNAKSASPNVFANALDTFVWGSGGGYQMTSARDPAEPTSPAGGIPMKLVTSGTSAYLGTYNSTPFNLAPAAQGQTWTVSFWIKSNTPVTASMLIFEANSSGNYIAYGQPYFNVTTEWTRVTGTYTFTQATAAFIQMRIDCYVSGVSLWVDGIQVERAPSASTFNPRVGNVWRDVVGNLNFDLVGAQPMLQTVGGTQAFTFNGSSYWQCNTGFGQVNLGGDCTVILWLYEVGHSVRRTVFEKAGTVYSSYEQELAITWEVGQEFSYYSRYNAYDFGGTPVLDTNTWTMMAIKMSTGLTASARTGFYSKNGASWTANYTSRSSTALVPAGAVRVGTGYAGTVDNGSIAIAACYNRMLSDTEIAQNFNAWRMRFNK